MLHIRAGPSTADLVKSPSRVEFAKNTGAAKRSTIRPGAVTTCSSPTAVSVPSSIPARLSTETGGLACRDSPSSGRVTNKAFQRVDIAAGEAVDQSGRGPPPGPSLLGEDLAQLGFLVGREVAGDQLTLELGHAVLDPVDHGVGAEEEQG